MPLSFMSKDLAIDLGTANTIVSMRGRGIVLQEPSVVAVRSGMRREVLAVGEEAQRMIGRTPGDIAAIRPLREGVIADFEVTEVMLRYFIRKCVPRSGGLFAPRVIVCVPCGITEVERRAVEEAAKSAGAREVHLLEEPMAAALGAGLDIQEPHGHMIADIGGGTCEVAVVSFGGTVVCRSLRVGGNNMDDAIADHVRREYNMVIGERTAETVKRKIGSVYAFGEDQSMEVRGRDLVNGLPNIASVSAQEIREALREPAMDIVGAVRQTLEMTPPELAGDIAQRGIVLSGGTAQLRGLDLLIATETGIPTRIASEPMECVIRGAEIALDLLAGSKRQDVSFVTNRI